MMTHRRSIYKEILDWYDKNKRVLPWRSDKPNPYHVWLSEVMLQQTTVPTVISYFLRFIQKWPTVQDLGKADLDEILVEWQGLGYYSRARNLHKCAQHICTKLGGNLPNSAIELIKLPGVGPYTAAAIASIAFDQSETVVDGNIVRVMSRLAAIKTIYPNSKPEINAVAEELTPHIRPGCYAQALMDLGSSICKPKNPKCDICPVSPKCKAFKTGEPETYPIRKPKAEKPTRYTVAFLLQNKEDQILLKRRAETGLLGGMMEVPSSPWQTDMSALEDTMEHAPADVSFQVVGEIKHTFTHFHLKVRVLKGVMKNQSPGLWVHAKDLKKHALPTLMKKIIKQGFNNDVFRK